MRKEMKPKRRIIFLAPEATIAISADFGYGLKFGGSGVYQKQMNIEAFSV